MENSPKPENPEHKLYDSTSFNLIMDGLYASIKLNKKDPRKGVTKEQAEESLRRWFPDFEVSIDDDEAIS